MFTPFDFLDLGSPHSVGMVLTRMMRNGDVRRLARGLYDVPREHAVLGELLPTADDIAQALARRDGATVQPAGAMAANLLSLSEQVPARAVYQTDGRSRTVQVGALTVQLDSRPPRQVRARSPMSSLVFAALRSLGMGAPSPVPRSSTALTSHPSGTTLLLRLGESLATHAGPSAPPQTLFLFRKPDAHHLRG